MTIATGNASTPASSALYGRAQRVIPGGVNSPVRAMRSIDRDPIFIESGHGSRIKDADGNTYIDWVCSWGPLILGHANPQVLHAITRAAANSSTFGAPTEAEVVLAEEVAERMPSVEMLRMTSSGTEASMSAIRLARAVTGREKLLKFAGAYHGHVDGLLAQAGSGVATQGIPGSPGVTAAATATTITIPWNDEQALEAAFGEHQFAAVLFETVPANMGVVPAKEVGEAGGSRFLASLAAAARRNGALLVADEVITGFRVARGGGQQLLGLDPDLTIMGKIVGGGLPAAAYGGRREYMRRVAPAGDVYQAGTLSGNPLAVAAGLATLAQLDEAAYARLAELTERLVLGLREAAASAGRQIVVQNVTGLVTPFFTDAPVEDYAGAAACDLDAYGAFCRGLLARGVYPPPSQFEAWFPSLAHTERDIELTVEAAAEVLREMDA